MDKILTRIKESLAASGGCSINLHGEEPESGYMVGDNSAVLLPAELCTRHKIQYIITKVFSGTDFFCPGLYVGVWMRDDRNIVIVPSVNIFDSYFAIEYANSMRQDYMYDVVRKIVVDVKELEIG
jgi:hypothetical protein